MNPEGYNQLIDELLDGVIADVDFVRLEAEMHLNPAVREAYYERLELATLLEIDAETYQQVAAKEHKVVDFKVLPKGTNIRWGAAAAIAIGVILGGVGWLLEPSKDQIVADKVESVARGFAVVGETVDAIWNDGIQLQRGDLVPAGELNLAAGTVQLDLFSGVTVVIEGEAEFEILSPMEMSVDLGKVQARVPEPAEGFKIYTAGGELVDLGTEFAIDVTREHAQISVINGEVEWYSPIEPMATLVGGESVRHTIGQGSARSAFNPKSLALLGDRVQELANQRISKEDRWLVHGEELARDSRVLAYFPMNQSGHWQRILQDKSLGAHDGAIVAAQRTPSRWGNDFNALDFGSTGSRVRVNIPGEYGAITFYCWVRINSLDRWYNSLFLTDGHEIHDPHWQIMNDGRLFFSVKAQEAERKQDKKDKHIAFSPVVWTPEMAGQWIQLAAVYNTDDWTITHYVNGEPVSIDRIEDESLRSPVVSIGAASIGNWSIPSRDDPEFAVRNLNGSIDEFAIFSEALPASEIKELYETGRP